MGFAADASGFESRVAEKEMYQSDGNRKTRASLETHLAVLDSFGDCYLD
jgi:hypothetical protein